MQRPSDLANVASGGTVTQKARGMVWGEAEKVGKGLTTQGLWLTCTFCSFLRMQGSFWVLNKRMMC